MRRKQGFTLLELLAVIGLLGLVLFIIVPRLDNISPRARLRAAARRVGSTIELVQGQSIGSGKQFTLCYELNSSSIRGQQYSIFLPKEELPKLTDPNAKPPPPPDVEHGQEPLPQDPNASTKTFNGSPGANYEQLEPEQLPDDVEIQAVTLQDGREQTSGTVYVNFSALGTEGSHIVTLRLRSSRGVVSSEAPISLRFNALTRSVEFAEQKLEWPTRAP